MLTVEENERLTRIGPGTPMGKYMRRFWWPLCLSTELPERDGAPLRVRMLGEDLIAFRDTEGDVGLIDAYLSAPPRAAVLRPQRGMRPALRLSRLEVRPSRRLRRHAVGARGHDAAGQGEDHRLSDRRKGRRGLVLYGPEGACQAEAPDFEWTRAPATHRYVSKTFENCNWLQALEGGLDTTHSSFAHNNKLGDRANLRQHDRRRARSRAHGLRLLLCVDAQRGRPASITASITT